MTATRCRQVRGAARAAGRLGHVPEGQGRGRNGEGSAIPGASPVAGGSGAPGRAGAREAVGVSTLVTGRGVPGGFLRSAGVFSIKSQLHPPPLLLPPLPHRPRRAAAAGGLGACRRPGAGKRETGSSSLCRWVVFAGRRGGTRSRRGTCAGVRGLFSSPAARNRAKKYLRGRRAGAEARCGTVPRGNPRGGASGRPPPPESPGWWQPGRGDTKQRQ